MMSILLGLRQTGKDSPTSLYYENGHYIVLGGRSKAVKMKHVTFLYLICNAIFNY